MRVEEGGGELGRSENVNVIVITGNNKKSKNRKSKITNDSCTKN